MTRWTRSGDEGSMNMNRKVPSLHPNRQIAVMMFDHFKLSNVVLDIVHLFNPELNSDYLRACTEDRRQSVGRCNTSSLSTPKDHVQKGEVQSYKQFKNVARRQYSTIDERTSLRLTRATTRGHPSCAERKVEARASALPKVS